MSEKLHEIYFFSKNKKDIRLRSLCRIIYWYYVVFVRTANENLRHLIELFTQRLCILFT